MRQRRLRAVDLRAAGWTYDEIAAELGVAHQTARLDVHEIMSEIEAESVPALREVESRRLDAVVYNALQTMALHPNTELSLKASDKLMQAIRTRAMLFGLNAPVEVSIQAVSETDAEIRELLQRVEAANQRTHAQIVEGEVLSNQPEGTPQ